MNGWSPKEYLDANGSVVGASATNQAVSRIFPLYSGAGMTALVVKLKIASATISTGITAKLQTAIDGDWVDSKTATISSTADVYITLHSEKAADQTYFPLLAAGRIVVTSGAGDAVTISSVKALQEL